jgi:hypothetical protein
MEEKYMLEPRPDITVYELALLWKGCMMEVDQTLFDKLPPEVQRHFEPSTYNSGSTQ